MLHWYSLLRPQPKKVKGTGGAKELCFGHSSAKQNKQNIVGSGAGAQKTIFSLKARGAVT